MDSRHSGQSGSGVPPGRTMDSIFFLGQCNDSQHFTQADSQLMKPCVAENFLSIMSWSVTSSWPAASSELVVF